MSVIRNRCAKPPPLGPASAKGKQRQNRGGDKTDKETQEVTAGAVTVASMFMKCSGLTALIVLLENDT